MQNEISFSSNQGSAVWHALMTMPAHYDQEKNPLELELYACDVLKQTLDSDVIRCIETFANNQSQPYLIIRNFLSIASLPLTPINDCSPESVGWRIPAAALLGLLRLSGHSARAFQDEMNGRLCHMVMPAKNNPKSFIRSTKKLDFHTEVVNGYFSEEIQETGYPISPEIFGLLGLRNPECITTTLLPISEVIDALDKQTIKILMEPNFTAFSQSSFDRDIRIEHIPVLKKMANGQLGMRYSHSKLIANTQHSADALSRLNDVLKDNPETQHISVNPGDALLLNNRTCVHGRSEILGRERFDGTDRWLIRIYGYSLKALPLLTTLPDKKHVMTVII